MISALNIFTCKIQKVLFNIKWRKHNKHNLLRPGPGVFDIDSVQVGKMTYGIIEAFINDGKSKLSIGSYCSIAKGVRFLVSAEHPINTISTYPFRANVLHQGPESFSKGDIVVDDDVWIGHGATIMSGVHIGQGAVIAAGAVVTKDVPPYAIVGGVPAKVIKYRFEPEMIHELLKVDYSELTDEMIREHVGDLYKELTEPSQLEWLPKKRGNE